MSPKAVYEAQLKFLSRGGQPTFPRQMVFTILIDRMQKVFTSKQGLHGLFVVRSVFREYIQKCKVLGPMTNIGGLDESTEQLHFNAYIASWIVICFCLEIYCSIECQLRSASSACVSISYKQHTKATFTSSLSMSSNSCSTRIKMLAYCLECLRPRDCCRRRSYMGGL
jgi:hypothetical protein